jgi:FtsZ-binding cell division protein ZapB
MTFQELLEVYNGQYIEIAGTDARNQCVDLANSYIKYVLHLPIIEFTNAKDFPSKAGSDYEYILNSPTGVPVEGDLVIWGGTYGHIAIFIEGDVSRFTSFDENYPTGSPCHVQEHSYSNVLGWLHPKNAPQSEEVIINELRADRDKNWNLYQGALSKQIELETSVEQANKTITNITNENTTLKESNKILTDQHSTDVGAIQSLTQENTSLTKTNTTLENKVAFLENRIKELEGVQPKPWWQVLLDGIFKR